MKERKNGNTKYNNSIYFRMASVMQNIFFHLTAVLTNIVQLQTTAFKKSFNVDSKLYTIKHLQPDYCSFHGNISKNNFFCYPPSNNHINVYKYIGLVPLMHNTLANYIPCLKSHKILYVFSSQEQIPFKYCSGLLFARL